MTGSVLRPRRLRWWQVRPIEFGLVLYGLLAQRVLILGLFVFKTVMAGEMSQTVDPERYAMKLRYIDMSVGPLDDWARLLFALSLAWWACALVSAWQERCYGRWKLLLIFLVSGYLLVSITLNYRFAMDRYVEIFSGV